ncbi:MAG: DUF1963 domain-containing protein [Polyangiales bacterium]
MRPDSPAHAAQRAEIEALLDAEGLGDHKAALMALVRPAIGLRTRDATAADLAVGATRVGGEPDMPDAVAWPEGAEGPLLFVLQVRLAEVTAHDLEGRLPVDGTLSLFTDRYVDEPRVFYWPEGTVLRRRSVAEGHDPPFTACGVDVLPELHLPPHSSRFVGVEGPRSAPGTAARMGSTVCLPRAAFEAYWDRVWLAWRRQQRPGDAGTVGVHQMLGYSVSDDTGEQGHDEEVLFGFDSDDRAAMEWGDVQTVWTFIDRDALKGLRFDEVRAAT